MEQQIKLHERAEGPAVVPTALLRQAKTWRQAVRFGWENRRSKNMTQRTLAEMTGMHAPHVVDYLAEDEVDKKGRERRDMPAKFTPEFEKAVGNSFASQWLAMQSQLTILEAMIADQKANV